jgi:hypothetical protein
LHVRRYFFFHSRTLHLDIKVKVRVLGATCGGLIYRDFEIWLKGLWGWSVSLHGGSVKGTWRGAPSPGILMDI